MALLITDALVKELLTMADAINMAEMAVREMREGRAENRPRSAL